MIRRLIKNFVALFTGEAVAQVCRLVSVIYIARKLQTEGFGVMNFSMVVISYFLILTNMGLGEVGVRHAARHRDIPDIAGTIISMRVFIALISFLVIAVSSFFIKKGNQMPYILVIYGLTLFPYALSLEWIFRGTERMKYNAYGKIITAVLMLALVLIFVRDVNDVLKAVFIYFVADYAACLFFCIVYSKQFGPLKLNMDFKRWHALLPVAFQLFMSSAVLLVYNNFGTLALGIMKSEHDVGIYVSAFKLISLSYAASYLFVIAIFPMISRLYSESRDQLKVVINSYVKGAVICGLPIGVIGVILGPRIICLLYGSSYAGAGALFQIMCWFAAINIASYTLSYNLIACDRQHTYLKILGLATIFNIVFNIIAIPLIGYYAPAIAIVAAEFIVLVSAIFVTNKFAKIDVMGLLKKPAVSALAMGLVLISFMGLNMALSISVAVGAYVGVLFATGAVTKDEILKVRKVFA